MPESHGWLTMNVPRVRVSLRIQGDPLDPHFLTQLLGVGPTLTAQPGDLVPRCGRMIERRSGLWTYRLDAPSDTDLGEAIGMLLAALPDDSTLWAELTEAYTVDLSCELTLEAREQASAVEATVLAALGRRGLALALDLHAGPEGER